MGAADLLSTADRPEARPVARWDEAAARLAAASAPDPLLGRCVYVSRLLGGDASLALHGGGNTSVKSAVEGPGGERVATLWVKGSGVDLATASPASFAPADLDHLRRLLGEERLTDRDMARGLRRALLDPDAPRPSVETLAHAALPHRFVLHAHPDAVLAVTSVPGGARRARRLFGPDLPLLPWAAPGVALGKAVADLWRGRGTSRTRGIVLLHHGVLTFAETAEQAWEALVDCNARALAALPVTCHHRHASAPAAPTWSAGEIAGLRQELCRVAGGPLVLALDDSPAARSLACRADVESLVRRGPLTPDHVLRTKRLAAVVASPHGCRGALARYARAYRDYFRRFAGDRQLAMLDPAPRVLVARGCGVVAAGRSATEATAALEIYRNTMAAILAAEPLGGFRPLPSREVFALEYWDLEREKLVRAEAPFAGRVAFVTGAASGIGRAIAGELLAAGAAVAGADVRATDDGPAYLGVECDVRVEAQVDAALASAVRRFGGIDLLVSNVGIFPPSRPLDELPLDEWRAVLEVNATSHLAVLRAAIPLLRRAAAPPAVVFIGSRNVSAPGPAAAAYSASKAALTQLARVAALELAPHGIRVNVLHPDRVFDTALWAPGVVAARARHYGISEREYRRSNLLQCEVTARQVARLAVALCGDLFACTTGAQIPVDGGDARVI